MRGAARFPLIAVGLIAVSGPAAAQQSFGDLDQPCMAAFGPVGYPHRFVPAEGSADARAKVRGVVVRSLLWRPGETVKVCFRSGTQKARARVAQFASEWMKYANLKLDFGDADNPQTCQGDPSESIKIDFIDSGPKAGFWSALGTLSRKSDHSLNLSFLGRDELPRNKAGQQMPEAEARRIVLHEFGHALGLFHEHQSPRAGCAAEYYEEAVLAFGALRGWSREQTIRNFQQLAETPELNATAVDRKSIMHYSLPPWLFKGGESNPCAIQPNFDLSEGDKTFIAKVYPKETDPQVVATGPTQGTTRSVKGAKASRTQLVADYRRALIDAGVEARKADSLAKEFGATLAGP